MALWTAQYRYPGPDRLDITVKGNDIAGKVFAPTWQMVNEYKKGILSEDGYRQRYMDLLMYRWNHNEMDFINSTFNLVKIVCGYDYRINKQVMPPRDMTLVCFCKADTFCHRYILADWIEHNWPRAVVKGERYDF